MPASFTPKQISKGEREKKVGQVALLDPVPQAQCQRFAQASLRGELKYY